MVRSKSASRASRFSHPPVASCGWPRASQWATDTTAIATIVTYTVGVLLDQASACAFALSTMFKSAGVKTLDEIVRKM